VIGEPRLVTMAPPYEHGHSRYFPRFQGDAAMSPLDEETIEASLTRINAGFQSAGSPEVFEQYAQGVYLNKPFRRSEQALEVARAGRGTGVC